MTRLVDTPYGRVPGCADCGVIVLGSKPHTYDDPAAYGFPRSGPAEDQR